MKIFKAIKKGFTLVELVIVIAVIAVLSAVLIPVFGNVVKDSRVSALKASLKTCTSNLIMYSLYNQVDYYTPSVIREFLKSEGIKGLTSKDSEFCEDGYSVWYNQQNYNFYLVKNDELADFVNEGTSTASVNSVNNGNTAAFTADIFGNVADGGVTQGSGENAGASDQLQRIPRRPEAITPNENLLLVATDEANKYILSGIETLYRGADTDIGNTSAQNIILGVRDEMGNGNLFNFFEDWTINDYTEQFDVTSTAWLNNVGNFITDAPFVENGDKKIADISNVIVSPNLGSFTESETSGNEITGNIRKFGETANLDGAVLNVSCVIEIASTNTIELIDAFYDKFSNAGVNIVISGNVTISGTVSSSVSSGTNRVSTVTGGGMNISSVVSAGGGSAVSGGGSKIISSTISSSEFSEWVKSDADGKTIIECSTVTKDTTDSSKNLVSVKLPDGKVEYKAVDKDFFNNAYIDGNTGEKVQYKYNTSSFSVNVSEFLKKVGITSDDQVRSVRITQKAYNNVYSTSVYLEYEINNVIYGKSFNFGVGHITSFDYYYRFFNTNFDSEHKSGENTVPQYFAIEDNESVDSKKAGSLTVKLPEGTLNLQSYKNEDFTIEVYYNETTRYYTSKTSEFGTEFKEFSHEEKADKEECVTWGGTNGSKTKINGYYFVDFGSHARLGEAGNATYFVNTVTINRIVIRDKDNNIMIVKYPG